MLASVYNASLYIPAVHLALNTLAHVLLLLHTLAQGMSTDLLFVLVEKLKFFILEFDQQSSGCDQV